MKTFDRDLKDLIEDLIELPEVIEEEILDLRDDFEKELVKTHSKCQDPYGVNWTPRKENYSWPILNKTGELKSNYSSKKSKNGFTVENDAPYAAYQNEKRKLLPDKELPDTWFELVEEAIDEVIDGFNKNK